MDRRAAGALFVLAIALASVVGAAPMGAPVPQWFPSGRPSPEFLAMLPHGTRVDSFGNAWFTRGTGRPHILILTHRDIPGYVVSRITPDGYLRLQRLGTGTPLFDQFQVGRRVFVYTAKGVLPAVVACPSTHFRRGADLPVPEATVDDLWVDVGAESDREAETMGISLLDPVTPTIPSVDLGSIRAMDGYAGGVRAASSFLVGLVGRTLPGTGTTTFAWVAGGTEGGRGSRRLLSTLGPIDSVYVVEALPSFVNDSLAFAGGVIPIHAGGEFAIAPGDSAHPASSAWADRLASRSGTSPDRRHTWLSPDARIFTAAGIPTLLVAMPVAFPGSGAEQSYPRNEIDELFSTVDLPRRPTGTDVEMNVWPSMNLRATPRWASDAPLGPDLHGSTVRVLRPLLEAYGVSEHERAVADAIRGQLPPEARDAARLDERGNLVLALGSGSPERLFVAHQDEIGYRIAYVFTDRRARVERKGAPRAAALHAVRAGRRPRRVGL